MAFKLKRLKFKNIINLIYFCILICGTDTVVSQEISQPRYCINDSIKQIFNDDYAAENLSLKLSRHILFGAQNVTVYQHQSELSKATTNGPISLNKAGDNQLLTTTTLSFLLSVWKNGELVLSPEMQFGNGVGNGKGVGAYPNAMYGFPQKLPYVLRAHYRHHFNFKNKFIKQYSITVGRYVLQEMFNTNPYASDPKMDFLNFAHTMLNAWDASTTAYGYTHGVAQALLFKRASVYISANTHNKKAGGDKTDWDIKQAHSFNLQYVQYFKLMAQPLQLRLLGFYNHYNGGDFKHFYTDSLTQQILFDSIRSYTFKYGGGAELNYDLTKNLGLFLRYSFNDGLHEDFGYTQCDGSLNAGAHLTLQKIQRPLDHLGIAVSRNTISSLHQNYLKAGGVGFMVGDGSLQYLPEDVFEIFYAAIFFGHIIVTADYQYMINVGYNRARGNAHFLALRLNLIL